ncbi:MAG: hypothetical protein MUO64_11010 [Anaerolineales bacterium]|nr:hypothetical protein [Anaerolineales bacterium]
MLFASVAFGLVVFFLTAAVYQNNFGQGLPWDVIFPLIFVLNMLVVGGLAAYFLDYPRLYLIAVLFTIPLPITILVKRTLGFEVDFTAFTIPALIIICMGLFYLARFLREYPVVEMNHDTP